MPVMKPRQPGTAKDAFSRLVQEVGGLDAAAAITGKSTSHIARLTDPDHPKDLPPVRMVMALEVACGQPIFSTWLVEQTGHRVVANETPAATSIAHGIVELDRRTTDLVAETMAALADGKITPDEERMLRPKLAPVRRALDRLDATFQPSAPSAALTVVA